MRQRFLAILAAGLTASVLTACAGFGHSGSELVYIGTHGFRAGDTAGSAHGIYAARFDARTGRLTALGQVAELDRATWLIRHPKLPILYSVGLEGGDVKAEGTLVSYAIDADNGKLRELNRVGAGGVDATHLGLDAASNTVFSANHGSGGVSAITLQPDGTLGKVTSVQKDYGTGPNPRQSAPHAHGVAIDGSLRYLFTADVGADRLFVSRFEPASRVLTPADPPFEALPPGFGPRHVLAHPNGRFVYVEAEFTGEIRVYAWNSVAGKLRTLQTYAPFTPDFAGTRSAGELVVSPDGRFLYLSLRGDANSIVVLAIDPNQGTLSEVQRLSSIGKTPWSLAIDPTGRWMLVANAGWASPGNWGKNVTGTVNVLKVDPAGGTLSPTSESLTLPEPVTLVFDTSRRQ